MSNTNIAKQITEDLNKMLIEEAKKQGLKATHKNGKIEFQGNEENVKKFLEDLKKKSK